MGSAGKLRFRITECLVLIAVIGTLASIAVPSCMLLQKRLRVKSLVTATNAFRQDMSDLISLSMSKESLLTNSGGDNHGVVRIESFYTDTVMDDFAGLYSKHYFLKSPVTGEPLLISGSWKGPSNSGPVISYCSYIEPE